MKIKEYAEGKGLTKGAIYKAIVRSGHSAGDLTDKRGNLTAAGLKILDEIYQEPDQDPQREPLKETKTEDSALDESREALRAELERLQDQYCKAEERAEKWERLYLELQDRAAQEREAHREELRAAHVLAAQAQETISKLSTNPIKRLFSGRKKKNEIKTEGDIS